MSEKTDRHDYTCGSEISSPKRPTAIYNIINSKTNFTEAKRNAKKRNASSQAKRKVELYSSLADRRRNANLHYSQVNKKVKEEKPVSENVVPTVFKRIWDK
jgi:hypothetical protein